MNLVTIFKCPKFDEIQKKRDEFEERICIKKYSTTPSAVNLDGYPTCYPCINYNFCFINVDTDIVNTPEKMHEAMDELIEHYYRLKSKEMEAEECK